MDKSIRGEAALEPINISSIKTCSATEISEAFSAKIHEGSLPKPSNPNFLKLYNKKRRKDVDCHEAYQFLMRRKKTIPTMGKEEERKPTS